MLFHNDIKADGLPPRTVCLTYDDGPGATTGAGTGPRTAELGEYLASRGIAAAFFVIGGHAERHHDLLARLVGWGHLIGNHTYSHPSLATLAASGGDVIGEIARTDEIIAPHVGDGVKFLRPPYGNWREVDRSARGSRERPISIVARALNRDNRFRGYVGPINWDISGEDYDFWHHGLPAVDCACRYLERILRAGRGLILMHDSSEEEVMRRGNRTLEVTKIVVPVLEAEGYRFVRLDAIPQVQTALSVSSVIALRTADGRYLGCRGTSSPELVAHERSVAAPEQFGVVLRDSDGMALRASNGFFLAAGPAGDGTIRADAPSLDDALIFDSRPSGGDPIVLRAAGHSVIAEDGGAIRRPAAATRPGPGERWFVEHLFD